MANQQVELIIRNYKKITEFEGVFDTGNIYYVRGGNEQGKTSFLQVIKEIGTASMQTKNPTNFDAESGFSTMIFKGADGKQYSVKMDFDKTGNVKFSFTRPDMSRSNSVTEIRKALQFNAFTVEEFMSWSLTAEGRKKQASVMEQFLTPEDKEKLLEIDTQINSKNGTLYVKRTEVNKNIDINKGVINSIVLSEKEQKLLEVGSKIESGIKLLETELEDLTIKHNSSENHNEIVQGALNMYNEAKENADITINRLSLDIEEIDLEVANLKSRIEELVVKKEEAIKIYKSASAAHEEKVDALKKKYEALNEEKTIDYSVEINTLKARIENGRTANNEYIAAKQKSEQLKTARETYDPLIQESDKLTKTIEKLKSDRKNIFANSKLPVENIVIEEGELFIQLNDDLVPFAETDMSYSTAGKIVARMIARLNKEMNIVLLGKAAEYDKKSMEELSIIAKEEGAIMFCDYVVEDGEFEVVLRENK